MLSPENLEILRHLGFLCRLAMLHLYVCRSFAASAVAAVGSSVVLAGSLAGVRTMLTDVSVGMFLPG